MVCDKVRIRFQKTGNLRLVSHHDLMRCFERMLRRSGLPVHTTQGFHPKPRLVFALSLPLGVIGRKEIVELELDELLSLEEIRDRLARQAPDGLVIDSLQRIPPKATAHVQAICYRVPLPPSQATGLSEHAAAILASEQCPIARARPEPRVVDLRPFLRDLHVLPDALEIDLWVTPKGTARPEEVLSLLGLDDLTADGAVVERTRLELQDEATNEMAGGGFSPPARPTRTPCPNLCKESHEERNVDQRPPTGGMPYRHP
jgi:radical SAM-linked protein